MALTICTECGHQVSDKAKTCPNCGAPIHTIIRTNRRKPQKTILVALLAVLVLFLGVLLATKVLTPLQTKAAYVKELRNATVGSTIRFGSYEQDNDTTNGKEAIEWLVIAKEGDNLLVISKYALDVKPYHDDWTSATWETCSLRSWLNDEFYNSSFSSVEQALVSVSMVAAEGNPYLFEPGSAPGNDTRDKVFLLSNSECQKYLTSEESRKCLPTEYASAQGAWTGQTRAEAGEDECLWWCRDTGYMNSNNVNLASAALRTDADHFAGFPVDSRCTAIRPVLWIHLT